MGDSNPWTFRILWLGCFDSLTVVSLTNRINLWSTFLLLFRVLPSWKLCSNFTNVEWNPLIVYTRYCHEVMRLVLRPLTIEYVIQIWWSFQEVVISFYQLAVKALNLFLIGIPNTLVPTFVIQSTAWDDDLPFQRMRVLTNWLSARWRSFYRWGIWKSL